MRNTFLTESGDVRWERISELMGRGLISSTFRLNLSRF